MTGSGPLARILVCTVLFALACGSMTRAAAPVGAQARDARLDLAAAVLSPVDLEDLGLAGFQLDEGAWINWQDGYDIVSETVDVDDRDVRNAFSDDAGFRFGYDNRLAIVTETGRDSMEVRSTLLQFESPAAAESAILALTDQVGADLETDSIVGEWGEQWFTFVTGSAYVVIYQRDRVLAEVGLSTAFIDSEAHRGILAARISLMASKLLGNIDAALDGDGSGLALTTLRFDPEEPDVIPITDRYSVLRGRFIPYTFSDVTYIDFNELEIDAFGIITAYERFLVPDADAGLVVRVLVQEHESPDLAASYVPFMRDRLTFGFGYSRVEWLEDLDLPGETALAYTYEFQYGQDLIQTGSAVAIQSGIYSVSIQVDGPDGVDPDVVVALAEAQLSCLDAGICETVPYPGIDDQPGDDRSPDLLSARRTTV